MTMKCFAHEREREREWGKLIFMNYEVFILLKERRKSRKTLKYVLYA